MGNKVLQAAGFRDQNGGCGCASSSSAVGLTGMAGGWKYTRRASLASKKRLSARMSKRKKPGKRKKHNKTGKRKKHNNKINKGNKRTQRMYRR